MKSKVDLVCRMPERWAEKKLELGNNDFWIIQYDVSNSWSLGFDQCPEMMLGI